MGNPPFTQMLARSVIDGAILAAMLPPLAVVASPLFGASAGSIPNPFELTASWLGGVLYLAIPMMLIAVGFMVPLAMMFGWPLYRRGVKSHAIYIAVGALVGILTPLLLALIFGVRLEAETSKLLFVAWFVVSTAFGGWSFADRLSRQTNAQGTRV